MIRLITELHLLEYKQRMLEYLSYFQSARQNPLARHDLQMFSSPTDEEGYGDSFITHDLITDLYLDFVARVRESESIEYCKTRTGKILKTLLFNPLLTNLTSKIYLNG